MSLPDGDWPSAGAALASALAPHMPASACERLSITATTITLRLGEGPDLILLPANNLELATLSLPAPVPRGKDLWALLNRKRHGLEAGGVRCRWGYCLQGAGGGRLAPGGGPALFGHLITATLCAPRPAAPGVPLPERRDPTEERPHKTRRVAAD